MCLSRDGREPVRVLFRGADGWSLFGCGGLGEVCAVNVIQSYLIICDENVVALVWANQTEKHIFRVRPRLRRKRIDRFADSKSSLSPTSKATVWPFAYRLDDDPCGVSLPLKSGSDNVNMGGTQ